MPKSPLLQGQCYYETTIELWHEKQQVMVGYEYEPPCKSEFSREYLSIFEVEITRERNLGFMIKSQPGSGKYDREAIRFDRVDILPVLSDRQIRMIEIEILEMLHERQLYHAAKPGPLSLEHLRAAT